VVPAFVYDLLSNSISYLPLFSFLFPSFRLLSLPLLIPRSLQIHLVLSLFSGSLCVPLFSLPLYCPLRLTLLDASLHIFTSVIATQQSNTLAPEILQSCVDSEDVFLGTTL
jgi:hypothetical protein